MQVSDYETAFSPIYLVFLELDTDHCHLDFKFLHENSNVIIPRTFYFPTAPEEPRTYCLKKLTEAYLLDETVVCERLAKKMKRFNTITSIVDTGLITSTVITAGVSIAAFTSGAGLPFGIALSETSLLVSLATAITRKSFKIFTVKQEKHNAIKLLAQSKLDRIADIISQAIQDGDISSIEFHKVLQEVEKYCKLKTNIRNQAKTKVRQITKEQRAELLEQGRKEGKEDFLRKIANTLGIQGVSAI